MPQIMPGANSVDLVQAPHFVASELGLHRLHNTSKWVSDLKRVKHNCSVFNFLL